MLSINTNVMSLNAQYSLQKSQNVVAQAAQRLASGIRINSAKDDAAGLSVSVSMETQIRSLKVGARNANDAISLVQVADSGLASSTSILQRMRELSVQASNGTYSDDDLALIDKEYQELNTQLSTVADRVKFNKLAVISGDAGTFTFQVGASDTDTISVTTKDASSYLANPGDLTSAANAKTAQTAIDAALKSVSDDRAVYGGTLNSLDSTVNSINVSIENQSAARSRIYDADFAQETSELVRGQILQQAGAAMLAQANANPQLLLSLLK